MVTNAELRVQRKRRLLSKLQHKLPSETVDQVLAQFVALHDVSLPKAKEYYRELQGLGYFDDDKQLQDAEQLTLFETVSHPRGRRIPRPG